MPWIYLVIAGLLEVGFTTALRFTEGFTKPLPSFFFLIAIIGSLHFLDRAATTIPLGTAYAVWTGIGAAGTLLIGIAFFDEASTPLRLLFLSLLIGSIIGLKLL